MVVSRDWKLEPLTGRCVPSPASDSSSSSPGGADGHLDLIVAPGGHLGQANSLLLNNGVGGFTTYTMESVGSSGLALGDVDGGAQSGARTPDHLKVSLMSAALSPTSAADLLGPVSLQTVTSTCSRAAARPGSGSTTAQAASTAPLTT